VRRQPPGRRRPTRYGPPPEPPEWVARRHVIDFDHRFLARVGAIPTDEILSYRSEAEVDMRIYADMKPTDEDTAVPPRCIAGSDR
jgi:hypothetical protein